MVRAETQTEACEPILGVEAPCIVLFILRKCYAFEWFIRSLKYLLIFVLGIPLLPRLVFG